MSKNLTKVLSIVLALALALALVACGNNTTPTNTETPTTTTETPTTTTETPNTDPEPTDEPEPVMPEYSFDDNGTYVRADDEDVYEWALGRYAELLADAESSDNTVDERFVKMAKAEAELLDSAVMIPTTTATTA